MAGAGQLEQEVRRVRRWAHTTRGALDASALAGAVVLAGLLFGLITLLTDVGRWGLVIAVLPVANQVRVQVTTSGRWRRGSSRGRAPSVVPSSSLTGADLSGVDLSGGDLRHRSLADADLTEADLSGADLVAANLRRAMLTGARLGKADLSYGSLDGAACGGVSLFGATLVEASLRRVEARNANFERTDLRNADLRGADLLGVRFRGADVRGADFTSAKLAADALTDAVVDGSTTLADGSPGEPSDRSVPSPLRSTLTVVLSGLAIAVARPALHGLLLAALGTGTVMAARTSGGGLGQELAIVTAADRDLADLVPRAKPRLPISGTANSSTDGAVGDVATGREDSTPAELGELVDPGAIGNDERSSTGDGAEATDGGRRSPFDDSADTDDEDSNEDGGTDRDGSATNPEPGLTGDRPVTEAAASTDSDSGNDNDNGNGDQPDPPDGSVDTSPDPTTPQDDASDDPGDEAPELTEVEPVVPPGQAVARRVRIVVASEGGEATVTAASSLGQLEPRVIDGPDGWELGLPSGEIRVDVTPSAEGVSTACQIQVDGVERSFQTSSAGQIAICIVDLDPATG